MPDEVTTPISTPAPTPTPATPPAPNGGNNGDDEQPIMSSAKLKERLARAEETARKKLLAELGIEDAEADKTLLAEARKRKADELTEAQKAVAALEKEKAKREAAETELKSFQDKVDAEKRAAARDTAVKDALGKANAKAEKVLKLLRADHAAELDAVLKDDGTADEKKVTALVEVARKAYPEDFGRGGAGSPGFGGGRGVDPGKSDRNSAAQATRNALRNRF